MKTTDGPTGNKQPSSSRAASKMPPSERLLLSRDALIGSQAEQPYQVQSSERRLRTLSLRRCRRCRRRGASNIVKGSEKTMSATVCGFCRALKIKADTGVALKPAACWLFGLQSARFVARFDFSKKLSPN